jgi:hypothetical protein
MDYVNGTLLSGKRKLRKLDYIIGDLIIDLVQCRVVDIRTQDHTVLIIVQLSQLSFASIGAISKDDASSAWHVTGRPLTYNVRGLPVTCHALEASSFEIAPILANES